MKKVFLFVAIAFAVAACGPKASEKTPEVIEEVPAVIEEVEVLSVDTVAPADVNIETIEIVEEKK